jgi:hypothetical protein
MLFNVAHKQTDRFVELYTISNTKKDSNWPRLKDACMGSSGHKADI